MPLYQYECECGNRFEELRLMADRNGAVCHICHKPALIKISVPSKHLTAQTFTVYGHDGTILSRKQTTERTPIVGESREHEVTKM